MMQTQNDWEPVPCFHGERDHGLVLTTDPKPRLRWTLQLHQCFVDAVTQLGGPDKATPKAIMKIMGVKGLTLYHLKSHLQKFRLGKQPHNYLHYEQAVRDAQGTPINQKDAATAPVCGDGFNEFPATFTRNINQNEVLRMQIQVQRSLDEHLEVKHHLQKRIDAQRKYMQTILEKAYETVSTKNRFFDDQQVFWEMGNMKEIDSTANFPSMQDLQIYGDYSHAGILPTDDNISSCIIPMIWYDNDMQLQQTGVLAPCLASEENQLQMTYN